MRILDSLPWIVVLGLCATLGLAPYRPEPHVWEKLRLLAAGELRSGLDWLDLLMHGIPWVLLALKSLRHIRR